MQAIPFISVVIPHLNQSEALNRCLRSLADQTYPNDRFEVVVVDNGSSVPPRDVVGSFPGVRLTSEAGRGPGPARNRGVSISAGEIVAFIDADCVADSEWLAAIAQGFDQSCPRTIIGGDVRILYQRPGTLTALEAYESVFAYRQREYIEKQGFSGTGNLAVRRGDFAAIGPFPGIEQAEDRVWGRRAVALGYRFLYVPEMVVFHPARRTFAEIFAKWDRHVFHQRSEWTQQRKGRVLWVLCLVAVAASPIIGIVSILRSSRINGLAQCLQAAGVLVRIRLHRARQMARLLVGSRDIERSLSWNQRNQ